MSGLKALAKTTQKNIKHTGRDRFHEAEADLEKILLAEPHADWAETETSLIAEMEDVFPGASPEMRRAAIRLAIGFMFDAQGLIGTTIPMHLIMLQDYHWGEVTVPHEAEGAGCYWLFQASNSVLDGGEAKFAPMLSQFFVPNMFRPLAVRAWIRLQSVYLDTSKAGKLLAMIEKHHFETHNVFDVTARAFVDGDVKLKAEDAAETVKH